MSVVLAEDQTPVFCKQKNIPHLTASDKKRQVFEIAEVFNQSLGEVRQTGSRPAGPERNGPGSGLTGLSPADQGTFSRRTDRRRAGLPARLRKMLLSLAVLNCPDGGEPSGFFLMLFCPCHPYIRIGNGDGRHDS